MRGRPVSAVADDALRLYFFHGLRALEANPTRLIHFSDGTTFRPRRDVVAGALPLLKMTEAEEARLGALGRRLGLDADAALGRVLQVGLEETLRLSDGGRDGSALQRLQAAAMGD